MSGNEKARSGEATPEQAKGLGSSTGTGTTSRPYDNTMRQRGQVPFALEVGRENGLKAIEIQAMTGFTPREIRLRVNYARTVQGLLICADAHGYYCGTDDEVEQNIRRLRKTAASDLEVADAMERSLRQRQGQEIMDGW